MLKISSPAYPSETLVLRAFGPGAEPLTSRPREVATHSLLAKHGLAPPLLARFSNGLLYRFTPGQTCSVEELTTPRIFRGVARTMGKWHATVPVGASGAHLVKGIDRKSRIESGVEKEVEEEKSPGDVWSVMRLWSSRLPEADEDEREIKRALSREVEWALAELGNEEVLGGRKLVMGHCDLLAGNVLVQNAEESQQRGRTADVLLIDYEYSVACPAAFDIAEHFGEWQGFECDRRRTPNAETRRMFAEAYVESWREHRKQVESTSVGQDVEKILKLLDRFRGLPGLWIGLWGLVQAHDSGEEFDYREYGKTRLAEYWAWKESLGLEIPNEYSAGKRKSDGHLRESLWAS